MKDLIFLKLGGSLITDKAQARTPRRNVINRLAREVVEALNQNPHLRLVIGHGSGSFGHLTADKYGTRRGVHTPEQWSGFAEVWYDAHLLNQIVLQSFVTAGLPVLGFPPSASVLAENGAVIRWDVGPLETALDKNLMPIVNGDTVFDTQLGGTILSTEEVFSYLAPRLKPEKVLIAGIEPGVWTDYPECTKLAPVITPANIQSAGSGLHGSSAVDVTGGMAQKVASMLALCQAVPGLEALIFSGKEPGNILKALLGARPGTVIRAE